MADAKSNKFETQLLNLIFLGTSFAGIAQNSDAPLTSYSLQLHTADPGETGDMTTNEAGYTAYARVGVERTSSGWTIAGSTAVTATAKLAATASFPQCTGATTALITHFSVGTSTVAASTGQILYYGTVSPNITVSNGVTPRLTTNNVIAEL